MVYQLSQQAAEKCLFLEGLGFKERMRTLAPLKCGFEFWFLAGKWQRKI